MFYWFRERLRDAVMWPVCLVRYFPARFARLVQTLHMLVQSGTGTPLGRRLIICVHLLVVQLFDLVGGPEIAQFLMHLITHTTPLTPAEMEAARFVLGANGLRHQDVRVSEGGLMDWVFKVNGGLAFATWNTVNVPRQGGDGRHQRAHLPLMVHELTHVYQYQQVGSRYLTEAITVLIKTSRNCYTYGGRQGLQIAHEKGEGYGRFNREQQAQIAQDYFEAHLQKSDTTPYTPFITQLQAGKL